MRIPLLLLLGILQIDGTCMEPAIMDRSVVYVDDAYPFSAIRVGDVVKFKRGFVKYCHRVVAIRFAANGERYLITKGDNVMPRENVTVREYLGRIQLP